MSGADHAVAMYTTIVRRRFGALLVAAAALATAVALLPTVPAHANPVGIQFISRTTPQRCLDNDSDTRTNPRTNVQLYTCRKITNDLVTWWQFWIEEHPSNWQAGHQRYRNFGADKCLTYAQGSTAGAPVWTERCGIAGQGYSVLNLGLGADDLPIIQLQAVEVVGSLCVSAVDPSGGNRTGINLQPCWPATSQNTWKRNQTSIP
ncbi:hypothetical protein Nm8I071_36570 [Nonomuraea sp. TT08I-71]|nr:hypothetical protein Nm8I071_36570 [Nonomuraea sp. TT08I-71]